MNSNLSSMVILSDVTFVSKNRTKNLEVTSHRAVPSVFISKTESDGTGNKKKTGITEGSALHSEGNKGTIKREERDREKNKKRRIICL